jgi:hypothetical protein
MPRCGWQKSRATLGKGQLNAGEPQRRLAAGHSYTQRPKRTPKAVR